jgi:hypothetical protein
MSLGSAIFLSSVVIAVVMLYGLTKDRWRSGPFVKRANLTFLAIVAITGTIAGALYIWNQLPLALARQTEYAGLRLGISQDEVIYIKGVPQTVNGELETEGPLKGSRPTIEKDKLEKGKQVRDYDDWAYNGDYSRINVTFNMKKTAVTAIQCYSSDKLSRCPPILGIRDGDSEKTVIDRLGVPAISRIERLSIPGVEGATKYISYPNLGINFHLEKEQVYYMGINDSKYERGS